jgi:hypothetical protein
MCIMYMKLCPDGAEGSSYSMLTTFSNIAGICSSNMGNLFAGIWSGISSLLLPFPRSLTESLLSPPVLLGMSQTMP